ncbi:hypothetical protein ACFWVF_13105 [Streptomyces sp. NPDC058659]|uniref:hypothetical protein n=1 Tax=unclassified Streptomyces TaxID=2593676 RepID=UPI00364FB010
MTAEHPRPTSRITDALLPTPPAKAPEPPARSTPRPAQAPAPLAPPTTRPASERPTAAGDPPPPSAPPSSAAPARSTSSTAPASAPLAPPTVRPASERPTVAGDPPPPVRSTSSTAPASAPLAPPAAQGGAERATAAPSTPPPLPPVAPPRPASAASPAPEPSSAAGTPAPAYPSAPPHPASAAAPKAPAATGTPPAPPQRLAAPEEPRSATAGGALRQPRQASSSVPARPASRPAADNPVVPPAVPAGGPSGRTAVPHTVPDTSEARRGSASPTPAAGSAPPSPRQAPAPARAWASPNGAGDLSEVETTTRLRPIRDTPRTARPTRPAPVTAYGYGLAGALPPEAPVEATTRLRPVRERRTGRVLAVTACVVLGVGLIGGALAGIWLASADPARPAEPAGYTEAKDLWHNAPVDTLFPRTLAGPGAGPGAAARTWTRIVVAPDAPCSPAVLAKGLLATLTPLGCERVLRATYTDATASSVITVGLVFTRADAGTQRTLGQGGLTARLGADVPPALSGPSTVAARFGARQRASWWLSAPADLPVVVTAVSGFADGRAVDRPQPADQAMARGRTDATAQSGLGHEAKGITVRFEALLRKTVAATVKEKENAR